VIATSQGNVRRAIQTEQVRSAPAVACTAPAFPSDDGSGSARSTRVQSMQRDFDAFAERIRDPALQARIAAAADVDIDWLNDVVDTSIAESLHTLRLIDEHLDAAHRLLEIGSGLGVTSSFLASLGYEITSIEPGGSGFEPYERVNPMIRKSLGIDHPHHVLAVEDATAEHIGGPFDVIFSNNVIEHVDDVDRALSTLARTLSDRGVMIHHCPNYRVPYEPHFGIPLVPGWPAATAAVLPERISSSGLWASLNFVTARDVIEIADARGANVEFDRGVLADAFVRLRESEFGERHPLLRRLAPFFELVDPLVRRVPAAWATPMTFTWGPRDTRNP
jgi:2-polyprenyl-3-methyl-5-hydroxy-6-metoxy-1,4-benzoquinol methylase